MANAKDDLSAGSLAPKDWWVVTDLSGQALIINPALVRLIADLGALSGDDPTSYVGVTFDQSHQVVVRKSDIATRGVILGDGEAINKGRP